MEEAIVRKIKGGFVGLKNGTKEPLDVWKFIMKLKEINAPLAEDYETEYKEFMKAKQEKK